MNSYTVKFKEINNGKDKVIFVFSSLIGLDFKKYEFNSKEYLEYYNKTQESYVYFKLMKDLYDEFDIVFVNDDCNNSYGWYLKHEFEDISGCFAKFVDEYVEGKNYKKVFTFGSSKGGTGALLIGGKAKRVTNIISMVPQIRIYKYLKDTNSFCTRFFDEKDDEIFKNIDFSRSNLKIDLFTGIGDEQYSEVVALNERINKQCSVNLHILNTSDEHDLIFEKYLKLSLKTIFKISNFEIAGLSYYREKMGRIILDYNDSIITFSIMNTIKPVGKLISDSEKKQYKTMSRNTAIGSVYFHCLHLVSQENSEQEMLEYMENFFISEDTFLFYDHAMGTRLINILVFLADNPKYRKNQRYMNFVYSMFLATYNENEITWSNNHGFMQVVGIYLISDFFGFDEEYARNCLQRNVDVMFSKDFIHRENSTNYAIGILNLMSVMNSLFNYSIFEQKKIDISTKFYNDLRCQVSFGDSFYNPNKKNSDKSYEFIPEGLVLKNMPKYSAFFVCGYESMVHKHNDDCSFNLVIKDKEILSDPGHRGYAYTKEVYELTTNRAHNTVYVEDEICAIYANEIDKNKIIHSEKCEYFEYYVMKNISYPGTTIYRHFYMVEDSIVIYDIFSSDMNKNFVQNFISPMTNEIEFLENCVKINDTTIHGKFQKSEIILDQNGLEHQVFNQKKHGKSSEFITTISISDSNEAVLDGDQILIGNISLPINRTPNTEILVNSENVEVNVAAHNAVYIKYADRVDKFSYGERKVVISETDTLEKIIIFERAEQGPIIEEYTYSNGKIINTISKVKFKINIKKFESFIYVKVDDNANNEIPIDIKAWLYDASTGKRNDIKGSSNGGIIVFDSIPDKTFLFLRFYYKGVNIALSIIGESDYEQVKFSDKDSVSVLTDGKQTIVYNYENEDIYVFENGKINKLEKKFYYSTNEIIVFDGEMNIVQIKQYPSSNLDIPKVELEQKFMIFGSCVVRDVFRVMNIRESITKLYARSSLISVFDECVDVDKNLFEENFNERVVFEDLTKPFKSLVEPNSIIVMDLFEERFNIGVHENCKFTISTNFISWLENKSFKYTELSREQKYISFEESYKQFINYIEKNNINVFLIKFNIAKIDSLNYKFTENEVGWLQKIVDDTFKVVSENFSSNVKVIEAEKGYEVSNPFHFFSRTQYHYIDEFYVDLFNKINQQLSELD